jgi:hypothetical protein
MIDLPRVYLEFLVSRLSIDPVAFCRQAFLQIGEDVAN